jgi:hypothetical protein
VAIGKRGCFVQKKQLSVCSWLHDRPATTSKLQLTCDPAAYLPIAHNLPLGVVQHAAVAHHRSAASHRDDFTERGDPVSQRHVVL